MKRFVAPGLAACALLALAGCSDSAVTLVCPGGPSVVVNVVEGPTGSSVAAAATGTWSVGELTDSLRHVTVEGTTRLAAYGPPGTYNLLVQRPGFASWRAQGVVVPDDECGPRRAELTATLFPLSASGGVD